MTPFAQSQLQYLASLVARADAALVAATSGRGVDGNGQALPDLQRSLETGLECAVAAGQLAKELLSHRENAAHGSPRE